MKCCLNILFLLFFIFAGFATSNETEESFYYEYYDETDATVVEVESNIVGETSDLIIKDDHKKSGIGYKKLVRSIELGKVKYILDMYLPTARELHSCLTDKDRSDLLGSSNLPSKLPGPVFERATSSSSLSNTKKHDEMKGQIKELQGEVDKEVKNRDETGYDEQARIQELHVKQSHGVRVKDSDFIDPLKLKKDQLKQIKDSYSELIMKEKEALKQIKLEIAKKTKIPLGPVCEASICGACRTLVYEFAIEVEHNINNTQVHYLEELANSFCTKRELSMSYSQLLINICNTLTSNIHYKNYLLSPFEKDIDFEWDNELDFSSQALFDKSRAVCSKSLGVGACDDPIFDPIPPATDEEQAEWTSDCFVCRHVTSFLEVEAVTYNKVNENLAVSIVNRICDKMNLIPSDYEICRSLTSGKSGDNLGWMLYSHRLMIDQKKKDGITFSERACSDLNYCSIWIDSNKIKRIREDQEFVAVYD